jgi:hypothetical protein
LISETKAKEEHHFPKKRCVNVALKLISMSRPTTASKAASDTRGSLKMILMPKRYMNVATTPLKSQLDVPHLATHVKQPSLNAYSGDE